MRRSVIEAIRQTVRQYDRFLVCGHEEPDGDCIGSQLALFHWLAERGKHVVVVSRGPSLETYSFLPGIEHIQPSVPAGFEPEATVCVDTGSPERVVAGARLEGLVINIDHHTTNTRFGDVNWVDPGAAAVAEQIFALIGGERELPSAHVATCLYLALMTDTGSFRHANTSARTFEIAATLVRAGADPRAIGEAYYENAAPELVQLAGAVFSNLHFECGGRLVWGEVGREMNERLGEKAAETEQIISQMRSIRGVEVAVLFQETDGSRGKASLRSRGRVDVSAIAAQMGGGGHVCAAGCRFDSGYEAKRNRLLALVRRCLDAAC